MSLGYGIPWPVDGPPPLAPLRGLLQSADKPAAPVRINPGEGLTDGEGIERWGNGIEVYPYPVDPGGVWDPCSGSAALTKADGLPVPLPRFGAFVVYVPITCNTRGIGDQAAFRARAVAALAALEGSLVEQEFLSGDGMLSNPHLADGEGTFPNGDSSTSVTNGMQLLETEIALSGRQGIQHISPAVAIEAGTNGGLWNDERSGGILRTINGTLIVPGFGYAVGATPSTHTPPTGTEEWIYATGPIDIRRSEVVTVPDTVGEAIDLAGRSNQVTYLAERWYVVSWDTTVQAAVLVDRCQVNC